MVDISIDVSEIQQQVAADRRRLFEQFTEFANEAVRECLPFVNHPLFIKVFGRLQVFAIDEKDAGLFYKAVDDYAVVFLNKGFDQMMQQLSDLATSPCNE